MAENDEDLKEKQDALGITGSPVTCIVLGMAGSGKTTLIQRIKAYSVENSKKSYIINIDPAVVKVPYEMDIDIRDSVNYKKVMKNYNLGPNAAIVTSLNLFTTKFDSVIDILKKRSKEFEYAFFDTPGQVEVFTWSASGAIITEMLSCSFPTVVLYVIDSSKTVSPVTFMSNMLYACSIMYKTNLPFLLVFNKTDVADYKLAINWMDSYEDFENALTEDDTYMATLMSSMGLVLREFFKNLDYVGVSAKVGDGMDKLFEKINVCNIQFKTEFVPRLLKRKQDVEDKAQKDKLNQLDKIKKDLEEMKKFDLKRS